MEYQSQETRVRTVCLLILTAIALAVSLYLLRPVMIPFVISAFFAFALMPFVDYLVKKIKIPQAIAVMVVLFFSFGLLFVFSALIVKSTTQFAENADAYQQIVESNISKVIDGLERKPDKKPVVEYDARLSGQRRELLKEGDNINSSQLSSGEPIETDINMFSAIRDELNAFLQKGYIQQQVLRISKMLADILSQGLLIFIFVLFIMMGSKTRTKPVGGVWGEVEKKIRFFLVKKIMLSGTTGVLVSLVLKFLGIKFAMFFGFLTFLLNFIPSIGSVIATILPVPMAFLHINFGVGLVAMTLLIPGAIQFLIGNVIEPKIMGDTLDLHPVVILMSLIFWGMIWGIVGMLLAVPITAIIKILLERSELTSAIADVMAGRLDKLRAE